jgi:hypothetical protein
MPLLDHFHPPLSTAQPWKSVRRRWLQKIVAGLTRMLPQSDFRGYCARNGDEFDPDQPSPVVIEPAVNVPPPLARIELPWSERWDVRLVDTRHSGRVAGVVEIVPDAVKQSERERMAFAASCMIHLRQGASVVIIDGVTSHAGNLHNEIMRYCGVRSPKALLAEDGCYVAAYRYHTDVHRMDSWHFSVAVGQPIPTLPLCIDEELFVPVELEATYTQALADHNL